VAVRVIPRPAFIRDVTERIAWIGENRGDEQLDSFLAALAAVWRNIERYPFAGPVVAEDAGHVARMRLFPRPLPYLVYYSHVRAERLEAVHLLRLYASGQRREEIDMAEWPW
jgi:plasmid stabilization system protein ParE